ncbi:MAG: rod shape-determining protein MreC [Candidatus Pacebacteria bacterium]|nr:rod shape-determining protein MreC [Candidatus Paceibacterota bacterium]MDD4074191.1 rod shape-determining protein MreC [Candidatus Paceibacterota bacterium]
MNTLANGKIVLFLLAVILIIIFNNFFDFKNLFYSLGEDTNITLWQKNTEKYIFHKNKGEENIKLIKENQRLISLLSESEEIKKENEFLRNSLNLKDYDVNELIIGRIITKDFLSDSVIINIGSKRGVKEGFPVVVSNNVLLGKIVDVYPDYSRVLLLTACDNLTDVNINNTVALARGTGRDKITIEMFPRENELKDDDLIVTSPLGGNYPGGLLIGKVKNVQNIDNEPFQKSDIDLAYDIYLEDRVFVLKMTSIIND